MRLGKFRITVGRMMVLVAIAALVAELEISRRRYHYYQFNADRCEAVMATHLWLAEDHMKIADLYRKHLANPKESARYNREQIGIFTKAAWDERAKAEVVRRRKEAFRRAMIFPWSSVPPEEPEPIGPDHRNLKR